MGCSIVIFSEPSYPFCFIPPDTPLWVVHCSVLLPYFPSSSPKTLSTCGVIGSYYYVHAHVHFAGRMTQRSSCIPLCTPGLVVLPCALRPFPWSLHKNLAHKHVIWILFGHPARSFPHGSCQQHPFRHFVQKFGEETINADLGRTLGEDRNDLAARFCPQHFNQELTLRLPMEMC